MASREVNQINCQGDGRGILILNDSKMTFERKYLIILCVVQNHSLLENLCLLINHIMSSDNVENTTDTEGRKVIYYDQG